MKMQGVWLPIVTPFYENEIDFESYRNLIEHYISKRISGLIPLGTTGESPVVETGEFEKLVDKTVEAVNGRVPVIVGMGGNYTARVLKSLKLVEKYHLDGVLSVCPYYNRPGQEGLYRHFLEISEATDLNIVIYNIPYRTGVNLENETLFRLAEQENIIGVKDSCGDMRQSMDLLRNRPDSLSVLTGEDLLFYTTLVNGGDGGILASAHLETERFVDVYHRVKQNDHQSALKNWKIMEGFIPMLFAESNPAPVKFCLEQLNLIRSRETRLPVTPISASLQGELMNAIF
jgi:4-hydroxy-tetrahydrodipicolinate synthase